MTTAGPSSLKQLSFTDMPLEIRLRIFAEMAQNGNFQTREVCTDFRSGFDEALKCLWNELKREAPKGPLNIPQMMGEVEQEFANAGKPLVDVVAQHFAKFAEKLTLYFNGNLTSDEKRPFSEMHLSALQQKAQVQQTQFENEALETIWRGQLGRTFGLQYDPNLQTHEQIRAWINNPENVGLLQQVTELTLSNCDLQALPPEIGKLSALRYLNLHNNKLTSLPPEIGNLTALRNLVLAGNRLTSLPGEIGNLTALEELDLAFNQLTFLPSEIGNLTSLQQLRLTDNQLKSLPREIDRLTALRDLSLRDNQLKSFPSEIIGLRALRVLSLFDNQLTTLPPQIASMTSLQLFWVERNPLIFVFDDQLEKTRSLKTICNHYKNFMKYPTQSSLGNLFKLIASNAEAADIQNVFKELDAALQQKIVQLAGVTGTSTGPSTSSATIDDSLFTDIPRFGRAVRMATMEMFNNFSENQKKKVYGKVYQLAGKPKTRDPKWGEHHAFENMLRFVDALEAVTKK